MIKYLLLVSLITVPFAQTPEAVVTHYDLEGILIQEESSLQGSEDINSMNSMNMNQQDIDQNSMDLVGTESMDYSQPENDWMFYNNLKNYQFYIHQINLNQIKIATVTQKINIIQEQLHLSITQSTLKTIIQFNNYHYNSNIESSINQESTVSNMNIESNSILNRNLENSMPEQDSMYSISDPNDISAIEPSQQNMEDVQVIESTQISNLAEVNSQVVSEINNNNIITESNKISNINPNNNQIDFTNILESNVEYPTNNNYSNQDQVDPNMSFNILTNTDSLQSSPQMENGFVQSEVNDDNIQAQKIQDTANIQEDKQVEHSEQQENQIEVTENKNNHANNNNQDEVQQFQQSEFKTNKSLVQGECIVIYSQCNFKGESLEACNSLSEIQEFKAQIKSIYILEGLGLTVYDGENFTGKMHKFKSSQECLTIPLSFAQLKNPVNQLKGQNLRFRQ